MRKHSPLHSLAHNKRPLHFLCSSSPFAPKHRDATAIFARKLFSERFFPEPPPPSDSSRKRLRHEVLKPPQPSLDDPKLLRAISSSSPARRRPARRGQPPPLLFVDDVPHRKHPRPPL